MLISKFNNENIENEIKYLEEKFNFKFPEVYRKFLLKYNGGYTPKTNFKINKVSSDIRGFFGLGNANINYNLFKEDESFKEYILKKIVPIAMDSFGNYIVISVENDIIGEIYFMNHEMDGKLTLLTKDFTTFIRGCKSEFISEASKRSIREREEILLEKGKGHVITDSLRATWQAEIDKYSLMVQEEVKF